MRACLQVLALTAWPTVAFGHAGAGPVSIDANASDSLEAGFGLLLSSDEGWKWVCHEAVTTPESILTPRYVRSPGGAWFATVPRLDQARLPGQSMYRSADGCDWDPVVGLDDRVMSAVVFVDPERAVAATADLAEDSVNGLYASRDGGLTWQVRQTFDGVRIITAMVAFNTDVYATSFSPAEPTAAQLHHSEDGGENWVTTPIDVSEWADTDPLDVRVIAADERGLWWSVGAPTGHVLQFHTPSDGQTQTVLVTDGVLTDGAIDEQGTVWALQTIQAVHRSADGIRFEAVADVPQGLGIGASSDGVRIATSALATGALSFTLDADGVAVEEVVVDDLTGPLTCPDDSEQSRICEPLWEFVLFDEDTVPDTDDSDDTDVDSGCKGCSSTEPGAPMAFGLGLVLLWGRRRR
ncbi:MAG: WD40/YVTN/BNR-like repeat-containing protein [Myxococcota bacterium]